MAVNFLALIADKLNLFSDTDKRYLTQLVVSDAFQKADQQVIGQLVEMFQNLTSTAPAGQFKVLIDMVEQISLRQQSPTIMDVSEGENFDISVAVPTNTDPLDFIVVREVLGGNIIAQSTVGNVSGTGTVTVYDLPLGGPGFYQINVLIESPVDGAPGGDAKKLLHRIYLNVDSDIDQPIPVPQLAANPTNVQVSAQSGVLNIDIFNVGTGSISWTAETQQAWISLIGFTAGQGNGTISVAYSENADTQNQRIGSILITDPAAGNSPLKITITQAAAVANPVLSVTPTTINKGAGAGTGFFNISNAGGGTLTWSVSDDASWLTFSGPTSGTGSGTVNFDILANTGAARKATITVTDGSGSTVDVTVNQEATALASIVLVKPPSSYNPDAHTIDIVVNNGGGGTLAYTAASDRSWANIDSGATGGAGDTIRVSIARNTSLLERKANITVTAPGTDNSPQTFQITQARDYQPAIGLPADPTYDQSARDITVAVSNVGELGSVLAYSASVDQPWAQITSGASGAGGDSIFIHLDKNTAFINRSLTLTVTDPRAYNNPQTLTITQTPDAQPAIGITGNVPVTSDPQTLAVTLQNIGEAGSILAATVQTSGFVGGVIVDQVFTDGDVINLSISGNPTTADRTATVTITDPRASNNPFTFTVTQYGQKELYLSSDVGAGTGDAQVLSTTVLATGSEPVSYTAVSDSSWAQITAGATGADGGTLQVTLDPNPTAFDRTATITITDPDAVNTATFTITQLGVRLADYNTINFKLAPVTQGVYDMALQPIASIPDNIVPTVSNSALSVTNVKIDGYTVGFAKATDNATPAQSLVYELYISTSNNLTGDAASVKTNGMLKASGIDVAALAWSGGQAGVVYYHRVLVRDLSGNEALYDSGSQQTATVGTVDSRAGDETALMALYNAAGGSGWTNKTGWSPTGMSLSNQIYGVTTASINGELRVTGIDLTNNNLTGSINVPEMGNLKQLTLFSVYLNHLNTTLPADLGNCANLEYLYLCLTDDVAVDLATIRPHQYVATAIDGSHDIHPGKYKNGRAGTVGEYNVISGAIPNSYANLTKLKYFICNWTESANGAHDGITSVPAGLFDIATFEVLQIFNTGGIADLPWPAGIGSMVGLDNLALGLEKGGNTDGFLTGNMDSALTNLVNVRFVRIQKNPNLTIDFDQINMSGMVNLYNIVFDFCDLRGAFPTYFMNGTFPHITGFSLNFPSGPGLTGSISSGGSGMTIAQAGYGNHIAGDLSQFYLDNPDMIQTEWYGDSITSIGSDWTHMSQIRNIRFANNNIGPENWPNLDWSANLQIFDGAGQIQLQGNKYVFSNMLYVPANAPGGETIFQLYNNLPLTVWQYSPQQAFGSVSNEMNGVIDFSAIVTHPDNIYTWYKDGVILNGESANVLDTSPYGAGTYYLEATNPGVPNLTLTSITITV